MASSSDGSPQSVFRDWLRNILMSGCNFASRFAADQDRLLYFELVGEIDASVAENVADLLDQAGALHRVVVLLFPRVRDETEIANLIRVLASHPRWAAKADPLFGRDAREVGVELRWTTAIGDATHAMGFAPSGYMPVTRRAPFVALAAWTGGHENPLRTRTSVGLVTMGDAPPPEPEKYDTMFRRTQEETGRLVHPPEVPAKVLRRLAFRLSRRVADAELSELGCKA